VQVFGRAKVRKQREKTKNKKKRDALARNDVHWAGRLHPRQIF
jgi:hypothetical protein